MAKAKRERLRQAQLAPDYLPLGGASNLLSQDFPQSDRRESSESDAEEDCMRIQFAGKPTSLPKQCLCPFVFDEFCLERMKRWIWI